MRSILLRSPLSLSLSCAEQESTGQGVWVSHGSYRCIHYEYQSHLRVQTLKSYITGLPLPTSLLQMIDSETSKRGLDMAK